MTLCWEPGHETPIHDHSGSTGLMLVLDGQVTEDIYQQKTSDSPACHAGQRVLCHGEYSIITEDIGLHKISNRSNKRAVSLHLYCKPIRSYFVYNEKTPNRLRKVPSFHSKFGQVQTLC